MSLALAEKMRHARESILEVDGKKFTIRRPTEGERMEWAIEAKSPLAIVRRCIVDWNLTEADLVPAGMPDKAEFSIAAWTEYVNDKPDLWKPIHDELQKLISSHHENIADAKKN